MKQFFDIFAQYVQPDMDIIVAVSGGVDSMVLIDLVTRVHPADHIIVAHMDHSLRWDDSIEDSEFVAKYCDSEHLRYISKKIDIAALKSEQKESLEALARNERYAFFEEIRAQHTAAYILTAHHADDQIETILLNLAKWGKLHGLSGMQILSGAILRPLLTTKKSEIIAYASDTHIAYREDSSNQDQDYDRNKIRHMITPVLAEINPEIHRTIEQLALSMQELVIFFDQMIRAWLITEEEHTGQVDAFFAHDFAELDPVMQRFLIVEFYRRAHGGSSQGLSLGLIAELTRYILDATWGTKKTVGSLLLTKKQGIISIWATGDV